jgi:hypothetical protein
MQHEEHDVRNIRIETVSDMHVDDKPVVLVGDKPVEVKHLVDERKYIAACSTVCVYKGIRSNDHCADHVSHVLMHMATLVEDGNFVRTPVRHFVGAAVCMHIGKDGHAR